MRATNFALDPDFCWLLSLPALPWLAGLPELVSALIVLVCAMAACCVLGIVIELLAYRPLRGRSTLSVLLCARLHTQAPHGWPLSQTGAAR